MSIRNVTEDVVLTKFNLEFDDGSREFDISPIPLNEGDAYEVRFRVSDECVISSDKENNVEIVQPTEVELLFKIYPAKKLKMKRKWRYLNIDGIAPTYERKIINK